MAPHVGTSSRGGEEVKAPYSFVVLRYVHDIVREEFVNIGVVVLVREPLTFAAAITPTFGRLKAFFPSADIGHIKAVTLGIQNAVVRAHERLRTIVLDADNKTNCCSWFDEWVLPRDDSSLQRSHMGGGVAQLKEGDSILEELYERYVAETRNTKGR
jgi:hypothetical protein